MATIRTLRAGDMSKADPFTICITANPALETPLTTGVFATDPILGDQTGFDIAAQKIVNALLGLLPGQRENLFSDPAMAAAVRIISIFDASLAPSSANSLAGHARFVSRLLETRRDATRPFLARYGLEADVSFAVSASLTHTRASAWYTTDEDTSAGVPFTLDGRIFHHRTRCRIPGSVAIHQRTETLDALHEFQHAISSYSNGTIIDLYREPVDDSTVTWINNKKLRPIPLSFGTYNGATFASALTRGPIDYEDGWLSYHCEHISAAEPALMDDISRTRPPTSPMACQNDRITRQFVIDRIRAKMNR